jgi:hypothetical protein
MFTTNLHYQRQIAADRQEQLRRQAGGGRLRRESRGKLRRARPRPSG